MTLSPWPATRPVGRFLRGHHGGAVADGLFFTNSTIFVSMSIGIIIVVLLALLGSLTLLPALLAVIGDGLNGLWLPSPLVTAGALVLLAVPALSLSLNTNP